MKLYISSNLLVNAIVSLCLVVVSSTATTKHRSSLIYHILMFVAAVVSRNCLLGQVTKQHINLLAKDWFKYTTDREGGRRRDKYSCNIFDVLSIE